MRNHKCPVAMDEKRLAAYRLPYDASKLRTLCPLLAVSEPRLATCTEKQPDLKSVRLFCSSNIVTIRTECQLSLCLARATKLP